MEAYQYTPTDLHGWWGEQDRRPRCTLCQRVVFEDQSTAEKAAQKIRDRAEISRRPAPQMRAFKGKHCKMWHVGQRR